MYPRLTLELCRCHRRDLNNFHDMSEIFHGDETVFIYILYFVIIIIRFLLLNTQSFQFESYSLYPWCKYLSAFFIIFPPFLSLSMKMTDGRRNFSTFFVFSTFLRLVSVCFSTFFLNFFTRKKMKRSRR